MSGRGFAPGGPFLKMVKAAQRSVGAKYAYLDIRKQKTQLRYRNAGRRLGSIEIGSEAS
jgi:hypothetical protein